MGVILQGILGGFSGKVGPVVGGKWKDIDYMRGYVIPANPNTVAQQGVRAKFAQLVETARLLIPVILQPFWDMFYSGMSGFNAWISANYANASSVGILGANAVMSRGTLEGVTGVVGTYQTGTGGIAVEWDGTIFGNGLDTDTVCLVAYDISTQNIYTQIGSFTRVDNACSFDIPVGLTATNIIIWIFFTQGTGSAMIVSDSIGDVCAAA